MRTLSAELVDDVGGVAPVGVDETAANFHGGSVVAFPFATKDVFGGNQMERSFLCDITFVPFPYLTAMQYHRKFIRLCRLSPNARTR